MSFNPVRLAIARERRGLSGKELADACEVTAQTVYNWEAGIMAPRPEAVKRISLLLRFPESFFSRPDWDRLVEGAASFRARTKMRPKDRRAALAAGDLACELVEWIEARFELPEVDFPDLRGQSPELAAEVVRAEWLLGDKPIPNMVQLLESRGAIVFSLAEDCKELDAFSFWFKGRPIVLLNTQKSPERSRMDSAHELGHLVAHHEQTGKKEEEEADAFMGAFLMPRAALRAHVPFVVGLDDLIQRKRKWGVSIAALVYRLHRIGVVSDWQYRRLFMDISQRGYRTREPNSVEWDRSVLLPELFEALRGEGYSVQRIATELGWPIDDLRQFLLSLGAGLIPIEGGGEVSRRRSRANIRAV